MSSSPAKKRKMDPRQKRKAYGKNQHQKKPYMEVGQSGFMVTHNFREKDCVRESYAVLNEFADILYGKQDEREQVPHKEKCDNQSGESDEEEVDVSKQLELDIAKTQKEFKHKSFRFQLTDNGNISNCLFIKANVPDVIELGTKIFTEIHETKKSRTKNVLRFIPIEIVCKANVIDITNAAGKLFDKHLLKEPKTYAIIFNHRLNNQISRDNIIKELATVAASKNINNKVDLKNPQVVILVEVMKGFCCLSCLPDYHKFRKYNLVELVGTSDKETDKPSTEVSEAPEKSESETNNT